MRVPILIMIDGSLLMIIPPIVSAFLTYIIANKKAKVIQAKAITDVQMSAIEHVRLAEEKMREEIWNDLTQARKDNEKMRDERREMRREMDELRKKLEESKALVAILNNQITSLNHLLDTYKKTSKDV